MLAEKVQPTIVGVHVAVMVVAGRAAFQVHDRAFREKENLPSRVVHTLAVIGIIDVHKKFGVQKTYPLHARAADQHTGADDEDVFGKLARDCRRVRMPKATSADRETKLVQNLRAGQKPPEKLRYEEAHVQQMDEIREN